MQVAGDSREVIARRWRQSLRERASVRVRFTRAEMRRADAAAGKWMMSLATNMNMKPGATLRLVAVPSGLVLEFGSGISVTTDDATPDWCS